MGSSRLPEYKHLKKENLVGFSILIPFRNEQQHLPRLFASLKALQYPIDQFEIILIDDASTDSSRHIALDFMYNYPEANISCLDSVRQSGSPKKDALLLGITSAKFEWIVTTDADCTFPKEWLSILNSFILERKPTMVVGPVVIQKTEKVSFHHAFEQLDFLSLMGATIGGFGLKTPFLCNGAHLAYKKNTFKEVSGFETNDHISSGDDHFLLEKFTRAYPKKVAYLNTTQAVVETTAQPNWQALISQRIRWASKASAYTFWFSKIVGIVVFLANLITGILVLLLPFIFMDDNAFAKAISPPFLLFILFIKYILDYVLIARAASFFNKKGYLKWYPLIMICYPLITTFIALKALTSSYEWKGRRFKQ